MKKTLHSQHSLVYGMIYFVCAVVFLTSFSSAAQEPTRDIIVNKYFGNHVVSEELHSNTIHYKDGCYFVPSLKCKKQPQKDIGESGENTVFLDITVDKMGELAEKLGEQTNEIDSIVVRGPINEADFITLWSASFYGRLSVINLEYSTIENDKIPEDVFFRPEQVDYTTATVYFPWLRRIIFPEGLKEIGAWSFPYAGLLEEINLPSTLEIVGERCFSDCYALKTDPLVFPEGLTTIGNSAFVNCLELRGKVVLPSTLKLIDQCAFAYTNISDINFPEGLEMLKDCAFWGCEFPIADIPDGCKIVGPGHFGHNLGLVKIHIPENVDVIPAHFVEGCRNLKEANIPSTVVSIEKFAFSDCPKLQNLDLPQSLTDIGDFAFQDCRSIGELVFPSSLKILGPESCVNMTRLQRVYSKSPIPPTCMAGENGYHPFGNTKSTDITLYVPIGSKRLYQDAFGWSYFNTIIETEEFPTSGIGDITIAPANDDDTIYDLSGRVVDNPAVGHIYIRKGEKYLYTK